MIKMQTDSTAQLAGGDANQIATDVARHRSAFRPYQDVFDLWSKARQRRETTVSDYFKVLTAFADSVQRKALADITRKDILAFRDALTANEQSTATVNRKIGILKTLFRVGVDYELLSANPADQVRVIARPTQKARIGFSGDDLNRIFNSSIYTANHRPKGGGREACYWLPLLALFSGARIEELAQLLVTDIIHEPELGHYLNITDEAEHGKLKNASSRRRIPIHASLLDCGFLDYVETVRDRRFLFPDLIPNPRNKLGGYFSNFFSIYLRKQVCITDTRKVFHSFRHTFKDICRTVGIDEAVHDALTGHSSAGAGRKYGNEQYPLAPLFEAMERFDVPELSIHHLYTRPPSRNAIQTETTMISAYYGIVIGLSAAKGNRKILPYIFARCQSNQAAIDIADNQIIFGNLPFTKQVLVQAWVEIHREELIANWENGAKTGEFFRIDPLR